MTNLKQIVESVRDETGIAPCILLGNGINRFYDEGQQPIGAWDSIVKDAIEAFGGSKSNLQTIAGMSDGGLTNLEFMDLLIGSGDEKRLVSEWLKERLTSEAVVSPRAAQFLDVVTTSDCPVLTTNYDQFLEIEAMKAGKILQSQKCRGASFSPLLLSTFWGHSTAQKDGFSIWHIHGTVDHQSGKYSSSLRLTHSDYFNLFKAIDERLTASKNFRSETKEWRSTDSWLDLLFQRPIVMAGLRLNADEMVLRWLFMKRQKFYRRRNLEQPKFVQLVRESEAAENAFVNLVGGQILNCPTYDDLYR